MSSMKVEIKGLDKAIGELNKYSIGATQRVKEIIGKTALDIQRGAKKRCPVDTGALRNSITVDFYPSGPTAEIGPHMPYAGHVEFGTVKQKAQPYLFPAYEEERPKFEKAIKEVLKG